MTPAIRWPTPAHALPDDITAALVASALAYRREHPTHGPGEFAECATDAPGAFPGGGASWVTGDAAGWLAPLPAFPAWCATGAAAGNMEDFYSEWPADEAAIASAELEAAAFVFGEVTRQEHPAPPDDITAAAIDSGRMVIIPVPGLEARTAAAAASPPCPDCGQGWPDGCREDCPSRDD